MRSSRSITRRAARAIFTARRGLRQRHERPLRDAAEQRPEYSRGDFSTTVKKAVSPCPLVSIVRKEL